MAALVVFIIGAGPNIGKPVAAFFKEKGYSVAVGSRHPDAEAFKKEGYYPIKIDTSNEVSVIAAFAAVNAEIGAPNVVVYNAALHRPSDDLKDPLGLPLDVFNQALSMGGNVFTAAQQAIIGFRSKGHVDHPKAFIVTGNMLPAMKTLDPFWLPLDLQKIIGARLTACFANVYKEAGYKFVYAHLVSEAGDIAPYEVFQKSGPAHAKAYWDLIHGRNIDWDYRFTPDGTKLENYQSM